VSVLVKSLYIVLAKAIGRWLVSRDGFPFCIIGPCCYVSNRMV
jgi:hypothetical protein